MRNCGGAPCRDGERCACFSRAQAHRGCPTVAAATAAAEAALGLAVRRGTMDNVTVVVMALPWGAPS